MKNTVRAGSVSGCSSTRMKSPTVTLAGKHSSPEVNCAPSSRVRALLGGVSAASTPRERSAAANSRALPYAMGGR